MERLLDLLACLLLIALMGFMVLVNKITLFLTESGALSEDWNRALTFGTTVGATLFTMFISGRMQQLVLRSLEQDLQNLGRTLLHTPSLDILKREKTRAVDRKWRGALKIDSLTEKFQNWKYLLGFFLVGLNTATITTALAPSLTTRSVGYQALMAGGVVPKYNSSLCASIAPGPVGDGDSYYWKNYVNESVFFLSNFGYCPVSRVLDLTPSINSLNTSDYVYLDSGVAVTRSAIGAPIWTHSGSALGDLTTKYSKSLLQTRQCVPVMTSNPVQCQQSGNLTVDDSQHATVRPGVDATSVWPRDLEYQSTFAYRNPLKDGIMVNNLWLQENATLEDGTNAIGLALLAFSAKTYSTGQGGIANILAGTLNDTGSNGDVATASGSTYVVTCTLDARKVFDYRTVTLDLQATKDGLGSDFVYYLSGGDACTPDNKVINDVYLATAARSGFTLCRENLGLDGYFTTLVSAAGYNRGPPYAFSNSKNALEDVLGLAAAIAVANLPLDGNLIRTSVSDATVQATRLAGGQGNYYTLLFVPFGSLLVLAALVWQSIHKHWQPQGRTFLTFPENQRPDPYAGKSLLQLLVLGGWGSNDELQSTVPHVNHNEKMMSQVSEQSSFLLHD